MVATIALGSTPLVAQNKLVNGGFETGDFSGWTIGGNPNGITVQNGCQHAGSNCAELGSVGSNGSLSQTFTDTPGQVFTVSYWLLNNGGTPSDFQVFFNGATLYDQSNPAAFPYTQFVFNVTGTGSDQLTFAARNDPAYFYLDDASVTLSTTPEPGSLALLGTGMLALVPAARRKLRR